MPDELFYNSLGDNLGPSTFEFTAGTGYADTWNLDAGKAIANAAQGWFFGSATHEYIPQVRLTLTPVSVTGRTRVYAGHIHLTLTPCAVFPRFYYTGNILLRLTPIATSSLAGAVVPDIIPASTGGWAMGGAGVWGGSTPGGDTIPAIDAATGLPTVSLTGFVFGGGTTEPGVAEAVSTFPQTDVIVTEEGGFVFCAPEVTGGAATTFPASEVIAPTGGFAFGGAGVWGQVAPSDLPSAVLVGTGGFVLAGSGFTLDPAVTPTATVLVGTGGWKMGGRRPDPVEVTYPGNYDRVIEETAAFEMGGEGLPTYTYPESTVIASLGAFFLLFGAGLCTSKMPPFTAIVTGEGGFVFGGADAAEIYETFVLSGMAFEPSVFSGFNFNSFCEKGGVAYAAGAAGVYVLGGDHDAGEPINSGVRIGPINAGFDGEKRLRSIQFGSGGNGTSVRVRTDDGGEGVFKPDRDSNRVVVSRDLQGREMQIDVMGFSEISQFELNFLRLARR